MPPRKRTTQTAGISTDALATLRDRIAAKSADYTRTSKAYKSRCVEGQAVKLISQAKVLDMVEGWVQELINGSTEEAVVQVIEPAPAIDGQGTAGQELQDQDQGQVGLSDVREDYPAP